MAQGLTTHNRYNNGTMRFSLRSTFIAVSWIAWLLAALTVQHGLVPELFVLSQFATLAVAMSLALSSTARLKLFGICFTAGFLSWFALLAAESWFCDTQLFRVLSGSVYESF